ncbi:pyridoxamine 5'-phosphate oxidase [Noviherbaspirillum sp. 17J57-3]|uniref:Pyridoxamine 5'-phosphate oxidase n=1 Tax=Noviherbaspirillum galbum TaxID=2709383 RepID=A0A6B3SKF3_9BURK|nr:pyridoxamine 5'-phosphate oxidase [Noviherbaspirillum galbum]
MHLLHSCESGALATHSQQVPGYPFATVLPYAPTALHEPLFLMSGLAEHARNLKADRRASLLVAAPGTQDVLESARMTMVGEIEFLDRSEALAARYLRYRPEAESYLALGDMFFCVLRPRRIRFIGGFARMGWLDFAETPPALTITPEREASVIASAKIPPAVLLLGIDAYGIDMHRAGHRERISFSTPAGDDLEACVATALASIRGRA